MKHSGWAVLQVKQSRCGHIGAWPRTGRGEVWGVATHGHQSLGALLGGDELDDGVDDA